MTLASLAMEHLGYCLLVAIFTTLIPTTTSVSRYYEIQNLNLQEKNTKQLPVIIFQIQVMTLEEMPMENRNPQSSHYPYMKWADQEATVQTEPSKTD